MANSVTTKNWKISKKILKNAEPTECREEEKNEYLRYRKYKIGFKNHITEIQNVDNKLNRKTNLKKIFEKGTR